MKALARLGVVGRRVALQADLVRALGPGGAVRWRHHLASKASVRPPGRDELYRELWSDAASAVGASCEDSVLGTLRIVRDGRQVRVLGNLAPLDDPVTLALAGDKPTVHRLLADAGVPVIPHLVTSSDDHLGAGRFLAEHGQVVVKPAGSTGRGTGVTCSVTDDDQLRGALRRAAGWDTTVLVERQLTGEELRALVLDGEVIGVVRRHLPSVVGDGTTSIGDLIADENRLRAGAQGRRGLWPLRIDLDCLLTLGSQGFALEDVPGAGTTVTVKSTANENAAHDNETLDPVPDEVRRTAELAACTLGARLVSVEMIRPTGGAPFDGENGAVIEVNTTPGLLYHRQVREPASADPVAERILETCLSEGRPVTASGKD